MQFYFACFGFVWFLFSLVVGFFNLSFYGRWVKAPTWGVAWLPSLDNKYKEWDTLCDWESTKGLLRSATCLWPFYIHATVHSSASLESSTPASSFVVHLPLIASSVHFLSFFLSLNVPIRYLQKEIRWPICRSCFRSVLPVCGCWWIAAVLSARSTSYLFRPSFLFALICWLSPALCLQSLRFDSTFFRIACWSLAETFHLLPIVLLN